MKRSGTPNDLSGTPHPPPFSDPPSSSSHGFGRGSRKRKKRQLLSKKQAQQPKQQQQQQEPEEGEGQVGGAGDVGRDWVHPVKAKRKSSFPSQPVLKLTQHIEVSASHLVLLR